MKWQSSFSEFLQSQFEFHKKKNPRFSMRAYAKKLGVSPSTLSAIFRQKGEWNLSLDRAKDVLEKSGATKRQLNQIGLKMGMPVVLERTTIKESQYPLMTDKWFIPILVCFDLSAEKRTTEAIAARFGISETKVTSTIREMLRMGLVKKAADGSYVRETQAVSTTDDITNEVLSQYHRNQLDFAGRALATVPTPERDFTCVTFLGDKTKMTLLKQEIRAFQNRLIVLAETENSGEVFSLTMSLYPLRAESV